MPNLKKQKYYYEYIRIESNTELEELNTYANSGWRVVFEFYEKKYFLLERQFEIQAES